MNTDDSEARVQDYTDLVDYRRRVASHYAAVRHARDPARAWETWRRERDLLFATHPQSPLDPEASQPGYASPFAPYDPAFRATARPRAGANDDAVIVHSDGVTTRFVEVATLDVHLPGGSFELALYWLPGYGGGYFLPFRDATSGGDTYGGGRYLLDTVKGADLGPDNGGLILDFNFAYHPSCVYDDRWSCPLAPRRNHIEIAIPVGEMLRFPA